jgi:hypothetical protein
MKQSYLFKLFITILIGCLLLLSFLPHPHSWDSFTLPLAFVLILLFTVIAIIQSVAKINIQTKPHILYQLRAPPYPLF